eukprot:3140666-Prymnesium_polylepis.1
MDVHAWLTCLHPHDALLVAVPHARALQAECKERSVLTGSVVGTRREEGAADLNEVEIQLQVVDADGRFEVVALEIEGFGRQRAGESLVGQLATARGLQHADVPPMQAVPLAVSLMKACPVPEASNVRVDVQLGKHARAFSQRRTVRPARVLARVEVKLGQPSQHRDVKPIRVWV